MKIFVLLEVSSSQDSPIEFYPPKFFKKASDAVAELIKSYQEYITDLPEWGTIIDNEIGETYYSIQFEDDDGYTYYESRIYEKEIPNV